MSFGLKTPRQYIEDKHAALDHAVSIVGMGDDVTVVSIVSLHDREAGQMILADTRYDKRKLAARLRLCADILDPPDARRLTEVSTPLGYNHPSWTATGRAALVLASLNALADSHGYHDRRWTADELAIDVVMSSAAFDGCDPRDLEPACESWLRQRRAA